MTSVIDSVSGRHIYNHQEGVRWNAAQVIGIFHQLIFGIGKGGYIQYKRFCPWAVTHNSRVLFRNTETVSSSISALSYNSIFIKEVSTARVLNQVFFLLCNFRFFCNTGKSVVLVNIDGKYWFGNSCRDIFWVGNCCCCPFHGPAIRPAAIRHPRRSLKSNKFVSFYTGYATIGHIYILLRHFQWVTMRLVSGLYLPVKFILVCTPGHCRSYTHYR